MQIAPSEPHEVAEGLTPKRRRLVECMVWDALPMKEAAAKVGMSERRARDAVRDPVFIRALRDELKGLRESYKPQAYGRLRDLYLQDENKTAAVMAFKEYVRDEDAGWVPLVNISITPGYAVDFSDWKRDKVIEHQRISVTHESVDERRAEAWDE
jgi:hypothetical protein